MKLTKITNTLWDAGTYAMADGFFVPCFNAPKVRVAFPLDVTMCKYGGDSSREFGFAPPIRAFIGELKAHGFKPEYESNDDGSNFCFCFDISSKINRAYYSLWTGNHGQEILSYVHTMALDPVVLANIAGVDAFLSQLLNRFHVRKYR